MAQQGSPDLKHNAPSIESQHTLQKHWFKSWKLLQSNIWKKNLLRNPPSLKTPKQSINYFLEYFCLSAGKFNKQMQTIEIVCMGHCFSLKLFSIGVVLCSFIISLCT